MVVDAASGGGGKKKDKKKKSEEEEEDVDISDLPADLRMDEYSSDEEEGMAEASVGHFIVGRESEMVRGLREKSKERERRETILTTELMITHSFPV